MEFGSSHDGVPAGGGRDSLRLPWRSRAGKSQHLLSIKYVKVKNSGLSKWVTSFNLREFI